MMPPHVDGCSPDAGSILQENLIKLRGNGFNHVAGSPEVFLLPSNQSVDIDWHYQFDIHHSPEGQTGGSAPSEMLVWIDRLEAGARYRIVFHDFSAEFTAGEHIRYLAPARPEQAPGLLRSMLRRLGIFS